MSFDLRPLTAEHVSAFRQAVNAGFGFDTDLDDQQEADRFDALFPFERTFPVFDGDELVSTGADYEFRLTVPGGATVPTAGLTVVTVRPTHTRQGVLTMMMREHYRRARERGEVLGALWASEATIYGRFGYGPAARHHEVKLDARYTGRGGSEPGVTVRLVDKAEAEQLVPGIYVAAQPRRPGVFHRTPDWWKHRIFTDSESRRGGASASRYAVAFAAGDPVGYVSYRQKSEWEKLPNGEIRITELVPATDAGYRALWHYVTSIDLFPIVKYWNLAPDDPLWLLLDDGRAVGITGVADALWVRLIDLRAAIERRAYGRDGSVVLRVADDFCEWNDGVFRVSVAGGQASCRPTNEEPDVSMTASTLGALYLGGGDALAFARAGLIVGAHEDVETLAWLFRSSPEPWCPEIF